MLDPLTILQALGSLSSIFGAVLTVGTQVIERPESRYRDKVKQLQTERWGDASAELGELFVDVEESYDPSENPEGDDLSMADRYGLHITQQFRRERLEDLEEELERIDEPRECYEALKDLYSEVVRNSIIVLILSVVSVGSVWFAQSLLGQLLGSLLLGLGLGAAGNAVLSAYRYSRTRNQLDSMWEDYEFM